MINQLRRAARYASSKAATGAPMATQPINGAVAMGVVGAAGAFALGNMATNKLSSLSANLDANRGSMLGLFTQTVEGAVLGIGGPDMGFAPFGFGPHDAAAGILSIGGAAAGVAGGYAAMSGGHVMPEAAYFRERATPKGIRGNLKNVAAGAGNRFLNALGRGGAMGFVGMAGGALAGMHIVSRSVERLSRRMIQEGSAGFKPRASSTPPTARRFRSSPSGGRVARRSGAASGWGGDTVLALHRSGGRGAVIR